LNSGAKAVRKDVLKTGLNITTGMFNREPEQPMGDIFKNSFVQTKGNLEEKFKK